MKSDVNIYIYIYIYIYIHTDTSLFICTEEATKMAAKFLITWKKSHIIITALKKIYIYIYIYTHHFSYATHLLVSFISIILAIIY